MVLFCTCRGYLTVTPPEFQVRNARWTERHRFVASMSGMLCWLQEVLAAAQAASAAVLLSPHDAKYACVLMEVKRSPFHKHRASELIR